MTIQIHVNGAATIALAKADNVLHDVGFSEDGVDIDHDMQWDDVFVDVTGSKVPVDTQYFLKQCFISFDLVMYENGRFNEMLGQISGSDNEPNHGLMGQAGQLFIQGGNWFRLIIKSA